MMGFTPISILLIFVHVLPSLFEVTCLEEYIEEACYGDEAEDFLRPQCPGNEVMYIRDVYTYAKRLDTNCPEEASVHNRDTLKCCRYVNESEDCGLRYYGEDFDYEMVHYTTCSGQSSCREVRVAWNYTLYYCNQSEFLHRTNYMRQHYHCIPINSTIKICNATSVKGNPLYIWNDRYPESIENCGSTSGCACAVQSTNNSPIKIDMLDVRFKLNSSCSQRLYINDGISEYDIDCGDRNQFQKTTVFTSVSSSLLLRLDNVYNNNGGYFWIELEATDISAELNISCGPSLPVYDCGETIDVIVDQTTAYTTNNVTGTGNTTTSNSGTGSSTQGTNSVGTASQNTVTTTVKSLSYNITNVNASAHVSREPQTASDSSNTTAIIAAVVTLLLLLLGIILAYILWRKKKLARVNAMENIFKSMPNVKPSQAPRGTTNVRFEPKDLNGTSKRYQTSA